MGNVCGFKKTTTYISGLLSKELNIFLSNSQAVDGRIFTVYV